MHEIFAATSSLTSSFIAPIMLYTRRVLESGRESEKRLSLNTVPPVRLEAMTTRFVNFSR